MRTRHQLSRPNVVRRIPPTEWVQAETFAALKDRLLGEALRETNHPQLRERYQWAALDAAALAFATPWPSLFFPVLFGEKKLAAQQWLRRQEGIHRRNQTGET